MWRALSAPKARRILAQRNALGLKEPQHARPERARGVLPPFQGGTLFDLSFPARCAGLIPFGVFSAEDKLGHYWQPHEYQQSIFTMRLIAFSRRVARSCSYPPVT